jgi:anti-anti-sigma factor
MRLRIEPGRDGRTLLVEGELDLATAGQLVDAVGLCSTPRDDLVLDCSALSFIDAAGAHAMVSIAEGLPDGSKLVLLGPHGLVLDVMAILRVDRHPRVEIRP